MLDTESWSRLITGLIHATKKGNVNWEHRSSSAAHSGIGSLQKTALSPLLDQKVLRANLNDTTYEITADSFGRAPYELAVWETSGKQKRPIGSISSSTQVHRQAFYQINSKLETLFKSADSSIEDPEDLVNRLLGDLGAD